MFNQIIQIQKENWKVELMISLQQNLKDSTKNHIKIYKVFLIGSISLNKIKQIQILLLEFW
jgi:hypothetical protein